MSKSELVSIVTVYYNRAALVERSLKSLCAQTYDNIEIIIVDDGSTDGTSAEIEKFDDPRIRLIRKENSGFTQSVRAGVDAARGAFVAIHGSGDYSYPERIEKQVNTLLTRPTVGVVGSWIESERLGRGIFVVEAIEMRSSFFDAVQTSYTFTHGCVMFRKEIYDRCGGYRTFFTYSQDHDLWLRMSLICDYYIVPEILYRQWAPPGTVRGDPDKMLIQQFLSELARQCAHERKQTGRDLIDRFGHHAYLFMHKSRWLGDELVSKGANILIHLNDSRSLRLVRIGMEHSWSVRNLVYFCLVSTFGTVFYRGIVGPGLRAWRRARG